MKYYKRVDGQDKTTTVESYSHDAPVVGAVEISKAEYDAFIAALPPAPPPVDWGGLYLTAKSDRERVDILARKLGVINGKG